MTIETMPKPCRLSPCTTHRSRHTGCADCCGCAGVIAFLLLVIATPPTAAAGPSSTGPEIGIRDRSPRLHALVNVRIVQRPGQAAYEGTVIVRDGVITAIGAHVVVPAEARLWNLTGKTIYAALIDAYSDVELTSSPGPAAYWNNNMRAERSLVQDWKRDSRHEKTLREAGFAMRLIAPRNGIFKGVSTLVTTGTAAVADSVVVAEVAQHLRLTAPRNAGRDRYPNSPMGAVALARQALYDAQWYRDAWKVFRNDPRAPRPEINTALQSLARALDQDQLFIVDAPDEQYALRADRFAREFGLRIALRGSGREYQRLDAIQGTHRTVITPVDFPKPPNVRTPNAARNATLVDLMHWRLAPENPARLVRAGVTIAFTSHGLKDKTQFRKMVRQAVQRGLNAEVALRACTTSPAQLFGVADKVGTLDVGKAANFMITDGDWLAEKTKVVETWVDGVRFAHQPQVTDDLAGTWQLDLQTQDPVRKTLFLELKSAAGKLSGTASRMDPAERSDRDESDRDQNAKAGEDETPEEQEKEPPQQTKLKELQASFGRLSTSFSAEIWQAQGTVRLSATLLHDKSPRLVGELLDETGSPVTLMGRRVSRPEEDEPDSGEGRNDKAAAVTKTATGSEAEADDGAVAEAIAEGEGDAFSAIEMNYPLGAFGRTAPPPTHGAVAIENATLWTCGPAGTIKQGTILFERGKITAVGSDVAIPAKALRINAQGKHVTPGIIDCHSHMATDGGVNESAQAITSEVRIGDFIDATDINIYRQLAGGVTVANVLHGSANPIGGQNQVIKLRWGSLPAEMKFAEAPAGIKFALGENVKQSNRGARFASRYPQSRMGVEQIIRDAFLAARAYGNRWAEWNAEHRGLPPRRDLELDSILQILDHQRWIHCHSYRQDEILALLRTLESFDIQIGTLQHILEGYKVAEEMQRHGAMGSAFSDWWAYKFEVYDAIPYNGALMHQAGVVVSFNSDDRELARHLNHEAAKAVKYGGVPVEEALKFVTLNPARQLRIDQYVGSLEVGKQADLVVWSGPPLAIFSRCEQTWIDGRRYFSLKADKDLRERDARVREKLVRRILDSGEAMQKPGQREPMERDLWPREDLFCGRHGHDEEHDRGHNIH